MTNKHFDSGNVHSVVLMRCSRSHEAISYKHMKRWNRNPLLSYYLSFAWAYLNYLQWTVVL